MAGRQIFSGRRGGLNNTDPIGLESGPAGEWSTLKRGPQNPDPLDMSTGHFFLLIETDPALTGILAAQLVGLKIEPIRVSDLDEALEIVKTRQYAVSAVLVPSEIDGSALGEALKSMRSFKPVLPCMAYGKAPERAQRKRLREAGVLLSLWDGYDVGILRFQVNRLVWGENPSSIRTAPRAPLHTPVRIEVGGREKEGVLYSISEGGCFIETPRASMDGATLRMVFMLDEREFDFEGVVVFANVPGNLQRPNMPLGMAIRFGDMPRRPRKPLVKFIQTRMSSLEV